VGDNEMIGFTPEGLDQILKRIEDTDEAPAFFDFLQLNPLSLHFKCP
jgi:hypothetical protein